MAEVNIAKVSKRYGAAEVIRDLDLDVPDGSFCVFVGPSGCGKSTLLRMIAGLETTSGGSIQIGGEEMVGVDPALRGVAMVFQSYALYPHMTVAENICFSLRMRRVSKDETALRLNKAAKMLKLDQLLDRYPPELSGGQRQRVAIGRAIVREPELFLFDEPLSNLDAALRVEMRSELVRLHGELDATMIYVTHDQTEAMTMADQIVVLNDGKVEQVGAPLDLYHTPKTQFVAQFLGAPQMNILPVQVTPLKGGDVTCTFLDGKDVVLSNGEGAHDAVSLGVRPEHLTLDPQGELQGEVIFTEQLGAETLAHINIGRPAPLVVKCDGLVQLRPNDVCAVKINAAACHLFGADGRVLRSGSMLQNA